MDPLAVIYNENQWRINTVSPLNNLKYDKLKLRQYSTAIKRSLASDLSTNASLAYAVTVEDIPELKYSDEDSHAIEVQVSSNQGTKKKVVYEAIFLSWGKIITLDNATHLPYLIDRGEQRIGLIVKRSLQNIFDCNIKDYCFTQFQLIQIGFNFLEHNASRSTDNFTIVFKTPLIEQANLANLKDKMSLTFEIGDVYSIWNSLKADINDETELAIMTYKYLQNQIYHMIRMDITKFDICEVNLPKAEVKSNGVVKMKTVESINAFFTVLNSITIT